MSDTGELHAGHGHAPNRFAVVSTPERFGDDGTLRGRGVTVAFLDSGFHPHPDITEPGERIRAYHDVHDPRGILENAETPAPDCWHGTQTCVAAAGSGSLSDGVYRGLASEAALVLVRVGRDGRITDDAIERGLEWVLANHERHAIRIVSMSLGGDADRTLAESRINQLAEEAVARGMVLVAAAGNSGCGPAPRVLPPATAPSVIAVGGYDDANDPERRHLAAYCSSFGVTADGLVKPELIAPAMWVAAPILPGTPAWRRAQTLARLASAPDYRLARLADEVRREIPELPRQAAALRSWVESGFAPRRSWLRTISTWTGPRSRRRSSPRSSRRCSRPIRRSRRRKSAGSCSRPRARSRASPRCARGTASWTPPPRSQRRGARRMPARAARAGPRVENGRLVFTFHDDDAMSVAVAGDFNGWDPAGLPMVLQSDGVWRAELPVPPPGRHRYKLVVDGARWLPDPSHSLREADPHGSFNSLLDLGSALKV